MCPLCNRRFCSIKVHNNAPGRRTRRTRSMKVSHKDQNCNAHASSSTRRSSARVTSRSYMPILDSSRHSTTRNGQSRIAESDVAGQSLASSGRGRQLRRRGPANRNREPADICHNSSRGVLRRSSRTSGRHSVLASLEEDLAEWSEEEQERWAIAESLRMAGETEGHITPHTVHDFNDGSIGSSSVENRDYGTTSSVVTAGSMRLAPEEKNSLSVPIPPIPLARNRLRIKVFSRKTNASTDRFRGADGTKHSTDESGGLRWIRSKITGKWVRFRVSTSIDFNSTEEAQISNCAYLPKRETAVQRKSIEAINALVHLNSFAESFAQHKNSIRLIQKTPCEHSHPDNSVIRPTEPCKIQSSNDDMLMSDDDQKVPTSEQDDLNTPSLWSACPPGRPKLLNCRESIFQGYEEKYDASWGKTDIQKGSESTSSSAGCL